MSSSQSDMICPKCSYEMAMVDFELGSCEERCSCERCGWYSNVLRVYDKVKGKEVKEKVDKLIFENKIDDALALINSDYLRNRSLHEKLDSLRNFRYDCYYYKFDSDKHPIYKCKSGGGCGAFKYGRKKDGVLSCGTIAKGHKTKFIAWVKSTPEIKYAVYTQKIKGKWYEVDIFTNKKVELGNKPEWLVDSEQHEKGIEVE